MPILLRMKPVEVQGVQWTGQNVEELKMFLGDQLEVSRCRCRNVEPDPVENWKKHGPWLKLQTPSGPMDIDLYATVIRDPAGDFFVVDVEAFHDMFEKLADTDALTGKVVHDGDDQTAMESLVAEPQVMDIIPYLWNMASEEASETGQAAAKCVRFGHLSVDPRTKIAAVTRFVSEMNDQLGVIRILNEELVARGEDPISGIGDEALLMESIRKRKDNLFDEHQKGRFTLPDETEG